MTIAMVQLMSDTLWREVTYTALLPDADAGPGPYPVLYLLHGGNQSHTSWLLNSRLVRLTRSLPLLVVLPDGAQSRWANGGTPFTRYEDFLVDELAAHVARTFHIVDGPWAIGGNSMGGFGAVRLGLKYPQRFCSVWAHSPGFVTADALPEHWHWSGDAQDLDCFALARDVDPAALPTITFDCGRDDHLLEQNRRFHTFLDEHGITHVYHERSGGHNWDYWDAHLPEALTQHVAVLRQR
jgi:putative tributyrin esterase